MKISVAGTGYVGLVTAVCLSETGHFVTCIDNDEKKIDMLNSCMSPVYEPGLSELMLKNRYLLKFTSDDRTAYEDADIIFICVGTPEKKDGSANLQYIYAVVKTIAENISRDCVIVVKSTVPVGTNDRIDRFINDNLKRNVTVDIVSNPEFLSQGTAVNDTLHAARIVLGVGSKKAETVMRQVYDRYGLPYVITDRRSAEMIKYASNDFLALKISYINEIANLCEIVGANVEDVTHGMGFDRRIGDKYLMPGIGYGGSCFPKDTKALHWLANFHDYELKTIKAAIEVNENQKLRLVKKARKYFESFSEINTAVLGLTFKPGTDDLREAPSLQTIPILLEDGANIRAWDPVGIENYKKLCPDGIKYCETIEETIKDAEVCFILTEWPEIREFDIRKFAYLMHRPLVIDGRNCYPLEAASKAGIIYESIGRRRIEGI
ncbi:MAG TPA: UDP-glucose/GDP-mannose dehydrogenase family protein [Clostridia bacterium]|nr:UDP-glucose/GDP-mannose dehydrogenase family protein [Clostridia bacterium]